MANKYSDIFELMRSTASDVIETPDKWKSFLSAAAMNYKRPFHNQLLIYNQRPDATACATFDYWNQKMGRFVKKGSKGIATIDLASQKKEILFDVSDTGSNTGAEVAIWKVTEDMHSPLGFALQDHFETSVRSGDLSAVLFEVGSSAAEGVMSDFVEIVKSVRENSLLESLDDASLERVAKETLSQSIAYQLLKRCGCDPEDYSERFDFEYINNFNTYDTIAVLGSSLNAISKGLLRDISLSVRSIENVFALSENRVKEEVENNEHNIHPARGLHDSERLSSETGNEIREVRDDAQDVSSEREALGVHVNDDEGYSESLFSGVRLEGDSERARVDSADGFERGRDGEVEGSQPDEVGGPHEQLPDDSRGDSSRGDGLRLNLDDASEMASEEADTEVATDAGALPVKEEVKRPDLSFEFVLTNVLQHHKYLRATGPEIQNYFVDNLDETQRIEFLKDKYNADYTELIVADGGENYRLGYHASGDGLEVWVGSYLGSRSRVVVPWNVVVAAVDVLIANDQYLASSEAVLIPTEEQQALFVAEQPEAAGAGVEGSLALPQQVIDEVICSGSNKRDSVHAICAFYKRNHSLEERVSFLADVYGSGTGKGFVIDGAEYSVVFEEDGIRIAEGRSVASTEESAFLSWKAVDKRVKELLSMGRYMSAAEYVVVEEKLLDKTASQLWDLCGCLMGSKALSTLSVDTYRHLFDLEVRRKGHSEGVEIIKNLLTDRERVEALLNETRAIVAASRGENPLVRIPWYELSSVGSAISGLDNLSRDVTEYPPTNAFEPSYKSFITEDEIDFDLTFSGSSFDDGKYRIYRYFTENHSASEKANFLKDEYGLGGGNGALGGVFSASRNYDSKGIVFSKGSVFEPYDTVTLSWSAVAKRIDKLIKDNQYLSEKEVQGIPDYEKRFTATEIYNFFSCLPVEVERPRGLNSGRWESTKELAELLGDANEVSSILDNMRVCMGNLSPDYRHFERCQSWLKDVELFAAGVSLFDFEARQKALASDEVREVAEIPGNGVPTGKTGQGALAFDLTDNVAYVYDIKPGDQVLLGVGKFEVMSIDNDEVVVNDVDFPLYTETYSLSDFEQAVKENHSNDIFRVPVEEVAVGDVAEPEVEAVGAEALAGDELPDEVVSEGPVYRYYFKLRHPDDGYPSHEGNEPLSVVALDERPFIEDFGIYSSGYVEYAHPLAVEDLNKYGLMLYEPPIVSQETGKRYQLGFGSLGNGTTVWNRLETEDRDYRTVAHISEGGVVTYYEKGMPQEAIDKIEAMAVREMAVYEERLKMAAEALAEVEKRYAKPSSEINRRTTVCKNYKLLNSFAGDVLSGKYDYMRFESEGYEPLYVERIGENQIAMAHTYVQNGDLMYDPEMVFSFDNEKEELQALSYEMSAFGTYQRVEDSEGRVNVGIQRELNSFLNTWLKNIVNQAQPLVKAIDRDGNEIEFGTDKEGVEPVVSDAVVEVVASSEASEVDEVEIKEVADVVFQGEGPSGHRFGFDFDEYLNIKDLYPDDIVAYRVGDFYEFLGEDAEKVTKELDLTLTSRDVGLSERLAMCGVPAYALSGYADKLIQNGYNIAVHGFNDKAGKVVTVDYETELMGSEGVSSGVAEPLAVVDDDKLVFEPSEQRGREKNGGALARSRGEGTDYRIVQLAQSAKSPKERFRDNVAAISLLKQLDAEGRLATPDEQKVLAAYVGWGGLSDAFDESKTAWTSEYKELLELLTPEEYSSAKASTLTAFYTSPEIIQFMYKTLEGMGFKKGNILEPSCGVGNFIGMMPESLSGSKVYGVELDSISGRIAQQLYQKQDIRVQGFEKTEFPDSFFDVAIGNVPFGDFKVNDKKYNKNNFLIHDYFFAKTLDKVRPGGIVAFITSKGTLDKENSAVREYIAQRAEFLGAVRLPDNAFKANAGTEVTSDIIFLQKRDKVVEIDPDREDWIELNYLYDLETGAIEEAPNGELMQINRYFSMHPECVLGDMKIESTRYGYDTACKAREGENLGELFKNVRFEAARDVGEQAFEEQETVLDFLPADPDVRNFSYTLVDDAVYFRENSRMYPITFKNDNEENRVRALINLRDTVRLLIEMQSEDYSESAIIAQRERLNDAYDKFSKKYGLINNRTNRGVFESDSSYYLLCSLENLDDEGKLKSKADIFYKRTIKPHVPVTSVDTSVEALEVSISEKACVDMPYMVQLSGKSADEIQKDLEGVIFRVPNKLARNGMPFYAAADEYLSGNVREKLRVAKEFAQKDERFTVNVAALERVQPKDLDASEISVRLGSTWIKPEYVEEFMYQLLDTPYWAKGDYGIKVRFADVTGEWFIENKTRDDYNVKANTTYGTKRASAYKIIEDTLNLRDARVYDYVEDENGRRRAVLNRDETTIAQQKQELIKEAFVEWIWKDPARREDLTSYYNEHFNNVRPREYDGSHLTFSGINPEITLRKHQLNAIARIIYGGNTLLAHAVGAGKTFEMIAAAQESKRLGLCTKSMFVVPNHLIEQFASDYMRLYPSANILCSTKKDFEPANRKKFCGRIATGDYDAVIIGHSQFEKIPMSVEGQRRALQEQLDDVVSGIASLKYEQGSRFSVKQLEKTKKNLEAKLEKLNDDSRKDNVIAFEELGIDRLFVDEAHYYKNLFLYTKMRNVAGIGSREAQKSSDLFTKCRYLDKLTNGKGIVFATGTPVSNSMTELYTMQRYLQYDMLCQRNLQHFDSWASTFGETITAIELAPEGKGYRAKTRFARFYNLPELITSFKEVADVQTKDMLHLPEPTPHFHTVSLLPSETQKDLVQSLADRATDIHEKRVKPNEDNMLLVTNDGRKLALDQRLIDPLFADEEGSKVNVCADNVFEIWQKTTDIKGTQLVFCDISTPKPGDEFDVYNDLKAKLVAKGIPEKEIAFVHNAKTDAQKAALFEKMRKGRVRVLLGSTSKLGVGSNVQDKLVALHDIDCPWRPSDLEQRMGRIVRQGNTNDDVDIYRYVTKDTFDAYSWQLIENKQSFISQIFTSKSPARAAEDIDEAVLSYAEIKSLATGDPRIKEKMDLDVSVKRLKLLKQSYLREKYSLEDAVLKKYPMDIARYTDLIAKIKKDIALLSQYTSDDKEYFFPMTVDGKVYADKGEAGEALIEFCKNKKKVYEEEIGEYRGFKLTIEFNKWEQQFQLNLKGELKYSVLLGVDKFGNFARINNLLASLPEKFADFENKLANTKVQLENAKKQLEKPFAHEQELKEKSSRLDQLNIELSLDKSNSIDIAASLDENEPSGSRKALVLSGEER